MAGKRRSNRDGSVYQTATGWRGYISLPRRQRKYVSGATRAEVVTKLKALQHEQKAGRDLGSPDQTLSAWLTTWLQTVQRTKATNTAKLYARTAEAYIIPQIGSIKLAALSADHVQTLLNDLFDGGLSAGTVGLAKAVLRRSLTIAIKHGLVVRNVAALADVPRGEAFTGQALTTEQVQQLIAGNAGHQRLSLVKLLLATGMRRGEVIALRWDDVDYQRRTLRITTSKTGARTIPLTDGLIALLKAQMIATTTARLKASTWTDGGWVFPTSRGTQTHGNTLLATFKGMLRAAGLPETVRLHDLRHTAISLMLEAGTPVRTVMQIVGHTQISTTLGIYAHSTPDAERTAIQGIEKLFGT